MRWLYKCIIILKQCSGYINVYYFKTMCWLYKCIIILKQCDGYINVLLIIN